MTQFSDGPPAGGGEGPRAPWGGQSQGAPGFAQAPQAGYGQAPPGGQSQGAPGFAQAPQAGYAPGGPSQGAPGFAQAPQAGYGQAPPGGPTGQGQGPAPGGSAGASSGASANTAIAVGAMGGGLAGVLVANVLQGKNPRLAGGGLLGVGLLMLFLNCVALVALDRYYPMLVVLVPPMLLGGGFIAATGRPVAPDGTIPMWWKLGGAGAAGFGLLVGLVLAAGMHFLG